MNSTPNKPTGPKMGLTNQVRSWLMLLVTLFFVSLYAGVLIGWLRPITDFAILSRLEPIIFLIIGYYFGRLPSQENEATLKDEILRQTQKADASQQSKERALQECEVLEEKVKNARSVLLSEFSEIRKDLALKDLATINRHSTEPTADHIVGAAMGILSS